MAISPYDENKNAFLEDMERFSPENMYKDVWNEDQLERSKEHLSGTRAKTNMLASIPMTCRGSECPLADWCPLMKEGTAPVGKVCPIELSAALQFFYDYVDELKVDTTKMVEVSMVRDLVDQEIQQMRKAWALGKDDFIQENVAGVDQNGEIIVKKELHQAIEYEDKILRRKERLRNALLATRESKAKSGIAPADSSQSISMLMEEARRIENEKKKEAKRALTFDDYEIEDAEIVEDDK